MCILSHNQTQCSFITIKASPAKLIKALHSASIVSISFKLFDKFFAFTTLSVKRIVCNSRNSVPFLERMFVITTHAIRTDIKIAITRFLTPEVGCLMTLLFLLWVEFFVAHVAKHTAFIIMAWKSATVRN